MPYYMKEKYSKRNKLFIHLNNKAHDGIPQNEQTLLKEPIADPGYFHRRGANI